MAEMRESVKQLVPMLKFVLLETHNSTECQTAGDPYPSQVP